MILSFHLEKKKAGTLTMSEMILEIRDKRNHIKRSQETRIQLRNRTDIQIRKQYGNAIKAQAGNSYKNAILQAGIQNAMFKAREKLGVILQALNNEESTNLQAGKNEINAVTCWRGNERNAVTFWLETIKEMPYPYAKKLSIPNDKIKMEIRENL